MKRVMSVMLLWGLFFPAYGAVKNEIFLEENQAGCKAIFLKKNESKCDFKKTKKIHIAPIIIPDKRDKKIAEIENKLNQLTEEFLRYKREKDQELKKITQRLSRKDRRLKKINTKLLKKQKELRRIKSRFKKKKSVKKTLPKSTEPMPSVQNLPWVEIVLEDGLNIYQLAHKYYKDKEAYRLIYVANRDIIGKDFRIKDGMSLKIPINEKFEDQPMFINLD